MLGAGPDDSRSAKSNYASEQAYHKQCECDFVISTVDDLRKGHNSGKDITLHEVWCAEFSVWTLQSSGTLC
jgi:hypothetical protein